MTLHTLVFLLAAPLVFTVALFGFIAWAELMRWIADNPEARE